MLQYLRRRKMYIHPVEWALIVFMATLSLGGLFAIVAGVVAFVRWIKYG